jgi:hypothetical protein
MQNSRREGVGADGFKLRLDTNELASMLVATLNVDDEVAL